MASKKMHPKFNVPNFGTKSRKRVLERWRKQRGQDSKKRIKKAFAGAEPTIGYKNPASVSGVRQSGRRLVLVRNAQELGSAMLNNKPDSIDVAFAKSLGKRKRSELAVAASAKGFRIVNA